METRKIGEIIASIETTIQENNLNADDQLVQEFEETKQFCDDNLQSPISLEYYDIAGDMTPHTIVTTTGKKTTIISADDISSLKVDPDTKQQNDPFNREVVSNFEVNLDKINLVNQTADKLNQLKVKIEELAAAKKLSEAKSQPEITNEIKIENSMENKKPIPDVILYKARNGELAIKFPDQTTTDYFLFLIQNTGEVPLIIKNVVYFKSYTSEHRPNYFTGVFASPEMQQVIFNLLIAPVPNHNQIAFARMNNINQPVIHFKNPAFHLPNGNIHLPLPKSFIPLYQEKETDFKLNNFSNDFGNIQPKVIRDSNHVSLSFQSQAELYNFAKQSFHVLGDQAVDVKNNVILLTPAQYKAFDIKYPSHGFIPFNQLPDKQIINALEKEINQEILEYNKKIYHKNLEKPGLFGSQESKNEKIKFWQSKIKMLKGSLALLNSTSSKKALSDANEALINIEKQNPGWDEGKVAKNLVDQSRKCVGVSAESKLLHKPGKK